MQHGCLFDGNYLRSRPVNFTHQNSFGKKGRLLGHLTFRVEHKATTIENQLIVPADRIAINQRALNFRNRGCQHLPAHAIFPETPRRCGNVDENLRALLNQ